MWYVYFLHLKNGDIYVGSSNDLRRRVGSHQRGQVASTAKYLPVIPKAYVAVADEVTARSLERYFKSGSGKAFAKRRFLDRFEPKDTAVDRLASDRPSLSRQLTSSPK